MQSRCSSKDVAQLVHSQQTHKHFCHAHVFAEKHPQQIRRGLDNPVAHTQQAGTELMHSR